MGDTLYVVLAAVTDAAAASNTRRLLLQNVRTALLQHLPLLSFDMEWPDDPKFAAATSSRKEDLKGSRGGTGTVLIVPLADKGTARLVLTSEEVSLPEAFLTALGSILSFGQRHCLVVERLAKLSSSAHHESQDLRERLQKYIVPDAVVASSAAMQRVIESAELVAGHNTTVLLRGESGTGKEVLARRIHRLSKRSRQPFVSVNCAALPETLIESELFGHERGAFTGATNRYRGRFERANNGTIFLDEIGDLPPSSQVKLLRVLQEGEFERLGGEETVRVNVRILAATNRPLEEMIENGTFRADLYYRLSVFPISIPPLRERKEDLLLLAQTLLRETAKRLGCPAVPLSPKSVAKLYDSPWPGNVRELANTIERALIMSNGRTLEFHDLKAPQHGDPAGRTSETFQDGSRRLIESALDACGGRIYGKDGAAARLGMPPSTLQGKMRRLGMNRRNSEKRR